MNSHTIAVQRQIKLGLAAGQWINVGTFSSPYWAECLFIALRNKGVGVRVAYRTVGHGFPCR